MTYPTDLLTVNAFIIASGGTGGHASMLPALNELCTLQSVTAGHVTNLPALNAIAVGLGAAGGYVTNLAALNAISVAIGGTGGHVTTLAAWTEIAGIGFGLSSLKSSMEFWSGDFDFENNLWLDKSDNSNDATLHGGHCIEFLQDVTITPTVSLSGKTVTAVNGSATTTGVSISGANIVITFASLPDAKIESITISDGQVFKLTGGAGPYIHSASNVASLGGTENTSWRWSTKDGLLLNLKDGFSQYAACLNNTSRLSVYPSMHAITNILVPATWVWEGYPYTNSTAYKASLFTMYMAGATYNRVCLIDRTNKKIRLTDRAGVTLEKTFAGTELAGYIKVKVDYNGSGYAQTTSWKLYMDWGAGWVEQSLTSVAATSEDRYSKFTWFGNANTSSAFTKYGLVRNHYFEINGIKTWMIYEGLAIKHNLVNQPDAIIKIPVFNGVDALGQTPTNPAFTDAHNKCEVTVKMKAGVSGLFDNDVNSILYTDIDTPKALDLTKWTDQYGYKLHVNNGTLNKISDLIVLNQAIDLAKYTNGFRAYSPLVKFRTDNGGLNDPDVEKLSDLYAETNAKGEHHTVIGFEWDEVWNAQVVSKQVIAAIHEINPAFWKYKDYAEGLAAYNSASASDKSNDIVMQEQGRIGCYLLILPQYEQNSGYNVIVGMHTQWGIAYPEGITPGLTDDNEDWWEWVLDGWIEHLASLGVTLDNISELGSLPSSGANGFHPEVIKLINSKIFTKELFGNTLVNASDNIAGSVSIFSGSENASIIDDSGTNVQKLAGYGTTAYGNLKLGTDNKWINAPFLVISFWAKSLQTSGNTPIKRIMFDNQQNYIDFGANISIYGAETYANPCTNGNWYKIVLWRVQPSKTYLAIYNADGTCALITQFFSTQTLQTSAFLIDCDGVDSVFKNVNVYADYKFNYYLANNNSSSVSILSAGYVIGDTAMQHIEKLEKQSLRDAMVDTVVRPFSHYVKDPIEKADEATTYGMEDRSYIIFKALFDWYNANGWTWTNAHYQQQSQTLIRENLCRNGRFKDSIYGLTGEIWGLSDGVNGLVVDAGETATSIDGSNVAKLPNSKILELRPHFKTYGLKFFRFWAKGNFTIQINDFVFYEYGHASEQSFVPATWTFYSFPFIVDQANFYKWRLRLIANADTYFQLMEID